ncbi:DUF928 domain-containing protein [Phormidium sp. LEGE 05292]|uniref:DUF928 domain-containing protein n=1 Tax=[Phormidium] sp. LEGE 05292 TaxID=767427 RepID=UPI00187F3563|nr:DUF928 domain-containing protein [Phormidium sp. LEGE 05292]MBE9224935.1 DUF928 domain-containing protein [Phormidium sp. LEGE 05292]
MRSVILPQIIAALCLLSTFTFFSSSGSKQVLAEDVSQAREGLPGRRVGGGTRSDMFISETPVVALVPDNNQGLTGSAAPTFFFYVPKTQKPQMVEFVLIDENERQIYETQFTTDGNSGVVGITIPGNEPTKTLEVGKTYRWYFAIVPDRENRRSDIYVQGSIKRVAVNQDLENKLKQGASLDLADSYKANNLWYDAMATVAELRRSRPTDTAVAAKWEQLLNSVNLQKLAQEPLVGYSK